MKRTPNVAEGFNSSTSADDLIVKTLAKLDTVAMGISLGALIGLGIFILTNVLILKGGSVVGPNLSLLNQYFIGYDVTYSGSLIGLIYGFISGFILGFLIAFLRNTIVKIYLYFLKLKGSLSVMNDYIDNP